MSEKGALVIQMKLMVLFLILISSLSPSVALAEESSGPGPRSAHLNFNVNVPQLLMLRVGSPGATIDLVRFDATTLLPTGTWLNPVSGGSQSIMVGGMIAPTATIRLTANSSVPMSSGLATIPFTKVRQSGTGSFASVSNLAFSGATNQIIWSSTGPGLRQGTFTYQFLYDTFHVMGYYTGTVTYTVAVP